MKTGFNAAEIFRKYLWYLLRERKFDTEAVNDVVQLKSSLQLSDEEVQRLFIMATFNKTTSAFIMTKLYHACCLPRSLPFKLLSKLNVKAVLAHKPHA
jgi:hypothetical protein